MDPRVQTELFAQVYKLHGGSQQVYMNFPLPFVTVVFTMDADGMEVGHQVRINDVTSRRLELAAKFMAELSALEEVQ